MTYYRQGFKDQVPYADGLFLLQRTRVQQALLFYNPDQSPLLRVNLLALKGTSTLDLIANFNTAQKEAYAFLADTPELYCRLFFIVDYSLLSTIL